MIKPWQISFWLFVAAILDFMSNDPTTAQRPSIVVGFEVIGPTALLTKDAQPEETGSEPNQTVGFKVPG